MCPSLSNRALLKFKTIIGVLMREIFPPHPYTCSYSSKLCVVQAILSLLPLKPEKMVVQGKLSVL